MDGAVSDWVDAFRRAHGRAPRLLHIGNVANNAYLNAKILNQAGIENHVACGPYHHIMGCPEWEDAPIGPDVGDPFLPVWKENELEGFQRPHWFVQGPWPLCWAQLDAISRRAWGRARWIQVVIDLSRRFHRRNWGHWLTRLEQAVGGAVEWLRRSGDSGRDGGDGPVFRARGGGRIRSILFRTLRPLVRAIRPATHAIVGLAIEPPLASGRRGPRPDPGALRLRYEELFPAEEGATPAELDPILQEARLFRRVTHHYDAIVGYGTEAWWALAAGKRPYFAYEHGTIRHLPFEATPEGRRCALTYRLADGVFVTNCDNVVAAERLALPDYRFVPHPVNETAVRITPRADGLRGSLREELGARFLVFHPSRQHWEERRHPDWEKGNDILIRGFARLVEDTGGDAGAIFVDWGQTVEESRALLRELGVDQHVRWIEPQPNRRMIDYIHACDVVADQFHLGAFGSTMPKALLCEKPAMLYLDEERHRWCFPELPPVLNARTPEEVHAGLLRLHRDPEAARALGKAGRDWYDRYHSNAVIRDVLIGALVEHVPMADTGRGRS
ncbi:MAG: hypothetical protein HKP30_17470 [Myxococcales bacterium]|nr:hypothetical protein [Myxococcales bacterium]